VVSEATRATGYLEGLFEGPMLDSKGIKDKESKIKYLTTLIDCVGNSLGRPIDVNPKKIVAGHEPDKTNGLLQALYEAATGDPGAGQEAVQRTLAGEKPMAGGPPPAAKSSRPQSSSQKKRSEPQPDAEPPRSAAEPAFPDAPPPNQAEQEKPRRRQKQRPDEPPAGNQPPPPKPSPGPAPGQAEANEFQPPAQRPMERPQTARRAPPKVKSNEEDSRRPASGKSDQPGADEVGPRVIGEGEDSDDDDNMIVEAAASPTHEAAGAPEEHGGLVSNLMAAQEAQQAQPEQTPAPEAADGAGSGGGGGGIVIKRKIGQKKDGKGNYGAEVATLREALQQLCQHANPLGKTMDYIQEDLDNMHKELEYWKSDRRKRQAELDDLSKSTEDHLGPLIDRQAKAKEGVQEMLAKITAVKSQIASNDGQIALLLRNVTTGSG